MTEATRIRFSAVVYFVFAIAGFAWAQQLPPYPKMSNAAADDMAKTYAFCMGQVLSVEALSRKFPELSSELARAQLEFDSSFKASVESIDAILSRENTRWESERPKFLDSLKRQIASTNVTFEQAKVFRQELSSRAEGEISSPYLETLLIYKPDFLRQPAEEFIRGYKRIFSSGKHPKSKGVNFRIEYPISWKAKDGVRPNVISVITSENGRGLEAVILMVRELPASELEKVSEADLGELFNENTMRQMLPRNARFISSTPIKLDPLPGAAVVFDVEQQELDMAIRARNLHFVTLYKSKLIFIQCSVGLTPAEAGNLPARFKQFEPLFRLIGNSLVVQSQW